MSAAVFAAPEDFVSSSTAKPAPEIVAVEIESEDCDPEESAIDVYNLKTGT